MLVKKSLLLCLILLLGVGVISAQDAVAVTVGENKTGEISAEAPSVLYRLEVGAPQSVNIQLLAISPALTPTFHVTDPDGVVIFDAANPGTAGVVGGTVNLASTGVYSLEVSAVGEMTGQFLLSVQAGAPLADAEPLTLRLFATGSVDADETRRAYSFASTADEGLALTIDVTPDEAAEAALVIALRDADTNETISLNRAGLLGLRYRLPATERNYVLELTQSGGEQATQFTLCLVADGTTEGCTGGAASVPPPITPAAAVAAIDPTGACQVASAGGQSINVRSGAGTGFSVVAQLAASAFAPVIGRLADNTWFQVNVGGVIGWVSASVVTLGGTCSGVNVVAAPVVPTAAPIVPTTASPGSAPTLTPTLEPLVIATEDTRPKLDGSLSTGAFTGTDTSFAEAGMADPFEIPFSIASLVSTPDAVVDVSYLGAGCSGYTTAGPQYHFRYASGTGAFQLRFYFLGSGYDTLIIQGPNGGFRCQKVVNVGIQFDGAFSIGGNYNVWVTTPAPNTAPSGSLYVSELPTP